MTNCPQLINGLLTFPKEGWECPADVEGFQRESNNPNSDKAWIFKSLWPRCPWRLPAPQRLACQKFQITMTCKLQDKPLQLLDCQKCAEGGKWK